MNAGRELDALVAEKVVGWKRGRRYGNGNGEWIIAGKRETWPLTWDQTPHYSTDIAAAWQVVEKLRADGYEVIVTAQPDPLRSQWTCEVARLSDRGSTVESEDTAPLAICLAALDAMDVEVPS